MEIRLAENGDLSGWVQLVEPDAPSFPWAGNPGEHGGLCPGPCRSPFPDRRRSVLWKTEPSAGCWPFPGRKMSWLSWQFQRSHRRQGIARKLAERMFRELDPTRPVKLITYRAGVPEGEAARSLYQRLGFCPGRLVEVDGSPAQEFLAPGGNSRF